MPSATKKVSLVRRSEGHYTATNARGGQIRLGAGKDAEFTPVELLLAAIGGCSSIDVDTVTSRRGEPTQFTVSVSGTKRSDEEGRASLGDVAVDFQLSFPDTEEGR
ncbi:MAG: OsmC family protein, partial [Cutibacterium sp.]|nr:OsmC family protein [Cutibacterium sp.]